MELSLAEKRLFLGAIPASRKQRRFALLGVVFSLVVFFVAVAFVHVPMPPLPPFVPSYESALAVIQMVSFVLLLAQFLRVGSPALFVLMLGYLYCALIIVPHILTFPGVFAPTGLLGANAQTTVWLFTAWHGGFPLFVIAYFVAPIDPSATLERSRIPQIALVGALCVTCLVLIVVIVATTKDLLPTVMIDNNYSMMVTKGVSPTMMALALIAIVIGWLQKRRSILDLWVTVVMIVWIMDLSMSSVIGSERYDVGWYMGRIFGLVAGTLLMAVLLWESNGLYKSLSEALELADARNDELQRSKQDLARVQRLDAMGQLTGGVAHDFNNVLQIISANLHILRLRKPDDVQVQDNVRRALDGVKRGARLSSELLSFASKQPLQPRVMNISQLLTSMDDILRHTLGAEIDIETVIAGGLWNTLTDPALLENAILNLALNARDAMNGVGKLTIEAGNASLNDEYVKGVGDPIEPGQYVVVAVTDSGSGIPEELMERVFEPFFTTKPVGAGTGLGLSMVYGFVKQSAGHVRIYSELGHGTTVKIYLPRSHQLKPSHIAEGDSSLERGSERILVVEDDEQVRQSAVEVLSELGYSVTQATQAAEAFAMIQGGLKIDLLFTDVVMPGPMKSTEMAARALEFLPGLAVLFTSGYTENAIVHGGRLDPGVRLISKPYRPEELSVAVRRTLDQPKS